MDPWIVLAAIIALGVVYVALPVALGEFFRYYRRKFLQCPVTGEEAWILIDARRAGASAAFGRPSLRIRSCSLWPARYACGRDCLRLPDKEMRDTREPKAA